MLKTLFTAAALLTVATPAFADEARTFTRDGQTYTYTQTVLANRTQLDGRNLATGETFHLSVRGTRVSGFVSNRPVSFILPKSRAAVGPTEVASR